MNKYLLCCKTILLLIGAATDLWSGCPLQLRGPGAGNLAGANGECAPCGIEVTYEILDNADCFPAHSCNNLNAFVVEGGTLINATNNEITVIWDCTGLFHSIAASDICSGAVDLEEAILVCGEPPTGGCCTWESFCPGINCAQDNLAGECRVLCGDIVTYTMESWPPESRGCLFTQWNVTGGEILNQNAESVTIRWACENNSCSFGTIEANLYQDANFLYKCGVSDGWVESQVCIAECISVDTIEPPIDPWKPVPDTLCKQLEYKIEGNCIYFRGKCEVCIHFKVKTRGGEIFNWTGVVVDNGPIETICFETSSPIISIDFISIGPVENCGINTRGGGGKSANMDWILWPNPASELLMIENISTFSQLDIFDVNGRIVLSSLPVNVETYRVDVSTWPVGLYMVRLKSEGNTATKLVYINRE